MTAPGNGGGWRDGIPKARAWLEAMTRQGEDSVWRGAENALRVFNALTTQNGAYRTLYAAHESEIAVHRAKANAYHAAITTLDSEREANALLTAEIERLVGILPVAAQAPGHLLGRVSQHDDAPGFSEGE